MSKEKINIIKHPEKIILFLVIIYSALIFRPGQNYINSDGHGYYAYLPAIFIYNDLNYNFYDDISNTYYKGQRHPFRVEINNSTANKTWPGLALIWLPFFLLAHLITLIAGIPPDGYSVIYQFSIIVASLTYLYLGLFYLKKLLGSYTKNQHIVFLVILLIVFATPLFHYAGKMPSFTHVYSFSLISFFLYQVKRFSKTQSQKLLLSLAASLGLIILLRPTNGLVVLAIPFICEDWKSTKQFFTSLFIKIKPLLTAVFLFVIILSIIPLLYKLQVNEWFIWQYRDRANYEAKVGFNFADPNFLNFLFSYRNGLFIYSPLLFISLGGFIPMFKTNRFQAISLLLVLTVVIYVLSSWHSWYYGMSFGMRAIIEYLPLFAILITNGVIGTFKNKNILLSISGLILISFTLIQDYQFRNGIFHWIMNKEKYWEVFIKTDKKYNWYLNRKYDSYATPDSLTKALKNKQPFYSIEKSFEQYSKTNTEIAFSGKKSMIPNAWNTFLFNDTVKPFIYNDSLLTFSGEIQCYSLSQDLIRNRFKLKIDHDKKNIITINSEAYPLNENNWQKISFALDTIISKNHLEKLQVYIQTSQNKAFLFDDFKINFYRD